MAYRTLFTVAHQTDDARGTLETVAGLAERLDAHLDILCLGIDEIQMGYFFAGADALLVQSSLDQARERADAVRAAVDAQFEGRALRWSSQSIVTQTGALTEAVAAQARYADLVVLPQPYGPETTPVDEAVLEAALFSADMPVLVVPAQGLPEAFPGPALIGWNGGQEALRAVRGALPLLRESPSVRIMVIDPPRRPVDEAQPGLALSRMLDRHGIAATLSEEDGGRRPVSQVLLEHAGTAGCGLLVAGAYGHSRFREAILGGATRDLLAEAPLPVLMTH